MTLTAADIQGADQIESLALFGIAIQKVPGKHSRQRPSAGSHSSQTRYAISLSYRDNLEIGGRRRPDSGSCCCHDSLRMSTLTASFSILPQPILTLRIPSLTSRSPAYHSGHLNWIIGIVVATRAFQSAHLPFNAILHVCKRATGCNVIHSMHTFAGATGLLASKQCSNTQCTKYTMHRPVTFGRMSTGSSTALLVCDQNL